MYELYYGVVENNKDPKKLGRVQVRIFGIHSEQLNDVPVDMLPWTYVNIPNVFGGLHQGIGVSSILQQGTWVRIEIINKNYETPQIISVLSGMHTLKDTDIGFTDPDGMYPLEEKLNEPDINRLARVEKLEETIHQTINDTIDEVNEIDDISGADVSQVEPNSLSDLSEYPNNNVIETASGHILEFDDTSTNERIRLYHKSGSYFEIRPDGSFIQKSVGETNHYIHMSDVNEHIKKGVKRYIEENIDEIINGEIRQLVKQNVKRHVEQNIFNTINGGIEEKVDMDFFKTIGGYFKIQADGNLEIINDVKITGSLQVTGDISSDSGITAENDIRSSSEIEDKEGILSALRKNYDMHTHIGNRGIPTAVPNPTDTREPNNYSAFVWSNTPLGFK